MAKQRNWERGKKTAKTKPADTPVNAKKTWTKSGGWRRFWKQEGDRQRDPKGTAVRIFAHRVLGLGPEWLAKNMLAVNSFGDLMARLKGTSALAEMSSQDFNHLFQAATSFRGVSMVLPFLCQQITPLLANIYDIFQEECQKLTEHYLANAERSNHSPSLSDLFQTTKTVDEFEDQVDLISPDYQNAAESLRPFLRKLADLYLAKRLVRELKTFAKPREEQVDDYVEL